MTTIARADSTAGRQVLSITIEGWVLLAILLLVGGYHAITIDHQPLFVDEVNEITIAQESVAKLIAMPDSMPPGYPLLLKAWMASFGVEQARWLSVVCGMATIVAGWRITRRLTDPATAIVAAGWLALLPINLYYSQFVRCYALLALLTTLAIGALTLAMRENRWRDWLTFALATAAGLYVHYYFALVVGALGAVHLVACGGRIPRRLMALLPPMALLALPLVSIVHADMEYQRTLRDARPLDAAAAAYTYFSYFSGYTLGPSVAELHALSPRDAAVELLPWAGVVAITSFPLLYVGYGRLGSVRLGSGTVAFVVTAWGAVALFGWLADITYNPRFLAWCAGPLALVLASGIVATHHRWWGRLATAGLILVCLWATFQRQVDPRYRHEDLRSAARYIAANAAPGDVVLLVSDYLDRTLDYYLPDATEFVTLPVPGETNHVVADGEAAQLALERLEELFGPAPPSFWLVVARPFHGDPQGLLQEALVEAYGFVPEPLDAPGVELLRTQR